jgi:hypothetical protein
MPVVAVRNFNISMNSDTGLAPKIINFLCSQCFQMIGNGIEPIGLTVRVAVSHPPNILDTTIQVLAQNFSDSRQAVQLPLGSLALLSVYGHEVITVNRGCADFGQLIFALQSSPRFRSGIDQFEYHELGALPTGLPLPARFDAAPSRTRSRLDLMYVDGPSARLGSRRRRATLRDPSPACFGSLPSGPADRPHRPTRTRIAAAAYRLQLSAFGSRIIRPYLAFEWLVDKHGRVAHAWQLKTC